MKSVLFEPAELKNLVLRNRFVRSATYDGLAHKSGHVSENQIKLFSELANGGVGLIITGFTYVHESGQRFSSQNCIASDDYIEGLRRLTACVHSRGAKIAVQLFHAGREGALFLKTESKLGIAPSFIEDDLFFAEKNYRAMAEDEIWNIVRAFGDAAKRAREADFDAVQLHGAHGYLFSQFLSPFTNRRSDDWGGTLEKRLRFHRETCQYIRAKVGEDYPVLVKLGVQDARSGGLELDEGKRAARLLAEWGIDALEISQGLRGKRFEGMEFRTDITSTNREGYFRDWCKAVKSEVRIPVMMIGGLRTFELIEEILQKAEADFVSLSRPFISEPGLIRDWEKGHCHKPRCVSCNKCLEGLSEGGTLRCNRRKARMK